jgi:hypothetical protein
MSSSAAVKHQGLICTVYRGLLRYAKVFDAKPATKAVRVGGWVGVWVGVGACVYVISHGVSLYPLPTMLLMAVCVRISVCGVCMRGTQVIPFPLPFALQLLMGGRNRDFYAHNGVYVCVYPRPCLSSPTHNFEGCKASTSSPPPPPTPDNTRTHAASVCEAVRAGFREPLHAQTELSDELRVDLAIQLQRDMSQWLHLLLAHGRPLPPLPLEGGGRGCVYGWMLGLAVGADAALCVCVCVCVCVSVSVCVCVCPLCVCWPPGEALSFVGRYGDARRADASLDRALGLLEEAQQLLKDGAERAEVIRWVGRRDVGVWLLVCVKCVCTVCVPHACACLEAQASATITQPSSDPRHASCFKCPSYDFFY